MKKIIILSGAKASNFFSSLHQGAVFPVAFRLGRRPWRGMPDEPGMPAGPDRAGMSKT